MPDDILLQFSRHLHRCYNQTLTERPGPFRAIELSPPQLTGFPEQNAPCLVFWANRESFFAGGLLLLPKAVTEQVLDDGRMSAQGLGLQTFYTWEATGIAAWAATSEQSYPLWTLDTPSTAMNGAEPFKALADQVLTEIQNRFFLDHPGLPRLTPAYLANLLHAAFAALLTELPASNPRLSDQGALTNSLLRRFMQLVVLADNNLLPRPAPGSAYTDQLDATSQSLPKALCRLLIDTHDPVLFQDGAARRLQHLALLLSQFDHTALRAGLAEAIAILQPHWANRLGLQPLPPLPAGSAPLVALYAKQLPEDEPVFSDIGPAGILALHATMRHLRALELPMRPLDDPMLLLPPQQAVRIAGTLSDTRQPSGAEIRTLKTRLRGSWPNRNLSLPPSAPHWHWQLVHLVGLLPESASLSLRLPDDWLHDRDAEHLYALISERLSLQSVFADEGNTQLLQLTTAQGNQATTICTRDGRELQLTGENNPELPRLRLALSLPAPLLQLVERGELRLYPEHEGLSAPAVKLFLRSTPGRTLWQRLQGKRNLPSGERLLAACRAHGIPLPRTELLEALDRLARSKTAPTPPMIDSELADWLGSDCLQLEQVRRAAQKLTEQGNETADTAIIEEATRSGVLRFPEDFLYNTPEAQRRHFPACTQLKETDRFFDCITLTTDDGNSLEVAGEASARALILASQLDKRPLQLPEGEQQTAEILERYAVHLKQLRTELEKAVAARGITPIRPTVERIWDSLPVPPRASLTEHLPQAMQDMV